MYTVIYSRNKHTCRWPEFNEDIKYLVRSNRLITSMRSSVNNNGFAFINIYFILK